MIDVERYRQDGFFLGKGFFPKEEIALVHAEAKEVFALQMRRLGILSATAATESEFEEGMFQFFQADLTAFTNCGKQAQHLISLHRLSLDERILSALQELGLEFPNISTRPLLYFNAERLAKKEVYWKLDVHQDWRSMQGSLDSVVVWLPLIDIDKSLGALEVYPGSHWWGLLNAEMADGYGHLHSDLDKARLVSVEVERGDALFFSTLLVHQSGTNVSPSIRWSCHFRYNNLQDPTFIARGFPHPYLYKPQEDLITPDFPLVSEVRKTFAPRDA
ncbi:MAG: phytanoyl-CoA dioxygenase family protein [Chthoniobacterales bacterium]|nr:phytanoyl-CoA dioxygenase family protein [Chthoniobacterales bacterium]